MSSFPAGALENPERIEVEWCPADQHGNSSFDHTGFTMFGNLRLYASPAIIGAEARADHLRNLKQAHGLRTGRTIQNTTTTTESGTLSFKDGTKVNYTYEKVGTEKFKYTIDGQVYKSGGGW